MFTIDKNVPPPTGASTTPSKYPWDKMTPGDSIFVPESALTEEDVKAGKDLTDLRYRVYQSARKYGAGKGQQFKAEVREETQANPKWNMNDGDETNGPQQIIVRGVRCWRLADPHDGRGPG